MTIRSFPHHMNANFVRAHVPPNALGIIALGPQPTCGLIDWHLLVTGGDPASKVSPQKIIREALQMNAGSFLVFVRKSEVDSPPGRADITLAKALREGGEALGVPLLDYVVVSKREGPDGYHSFRTHEGWTEPAFL